MNLLQAHCNESISMRLKELTDAITRMANQGTNNTNDTLIIIITAVISVVIAIAACICITMYLNRKYPKPDIDAGKGQDNNDKDKEKEWELKSKYLDFIKEETISYEKILKELDRKKKRADLLVKLQTAFDDVCNESKPNIPSTLGKKLIDLQSAIKDVEALDKESNVTSDNISTIAVNMSTFNNTILASKYLDSINSFLKEMHELKGKTDKNEKKDQKK